VPDYQGCPEKEAVSLLNACFIFKLFSCGLSAVFYMNIMNMNDHEYELRMNEQMKEESIYAASQKPVKLIFLQ